MGFPLDMAEMMAFFLEAFVYGIFFILFWILIIVLYHRGNAGRIQRRVLIPVGVAMLLLATTHLIINFVRIMQAFGIMQSTFRGSPSEYYKVLSHPLHLAKLITYVTQTIIGDAVIIWRCFIVYNKNWYIIIPNTLLVIVNACIGYVAIWHISTSTPGLNIFEISGAGLIVAFFVLTMCTSLICTSLIAWRLCFSRRQGLKIPKSLVAVLIAIVESGALYASSVLALLIAFLLGSNGQYPALDLVTPLVGVVFSLIVLQIQFHIGSDTSPITTIEAEPNSYQWRRTTAFSTADSDEISHPMRPVTVHITKQSEVGYPGLMKQ